MANLVEIMVLPCQAVTSNVLWKRHKLFRWIATRRLHNLY